MVWNANQNHSKAERKAAEIASALRLRVRLTGRLRLIALVCLSFVQNIYKQLELGHV